uniref:Uncharacterized protein n=1 Tax=Sphenodon punctatus TaxID=8508 RepID=A0A8D0GF45_SPHPU
MTRELLTLNEGAALSILPVWLWSWWHKRACMLMKEEPGKKFPGNKYPWGD